MKTTVVGLFLSCEEATNASKTLKSTGLKNIKLTCKDFSENRKNLFSEYFGSFFNTFVKKPEKVLIKSSENLVAGIFSKNAEKLQKARNVLKDAGAVHVFSFENESRVEAKSKEFIMKMITLLAKSEIKVPPAFRHHQSHEGMTAIT